MMRRSLLAAGLLTAAAFAQTTGTPAVPDWALPGSATHKQVPPPADFHRPSRTSDTPVGVCVGM